MFSLCDCAAAFHVLRLICIVIAVEMWLFTAWEAREIRSGSEKYTYGCLWAALNSINRNWQPILAPKLVLVPYTYSYTTRSRLTHIAIIFTATFCFNFFESHCALVFAWHWLPYGELLTSINAYDVFTSSTKKCATIVVQHMTIVLASALWRHKKAVRWRWCWPFTWAVPNTFSESLELLLLHLVDGQALARACEANMNWTRFIHGLNTEIS